MIGIAVIGYSQTNNFPLYSSGNYSNGTNSDNTDVTSPQLKLQSTVGFIRATHVSSSPTISIVHNYQTGKDVYWGEPSDIGRYFFRGRDIVVEEGRLGIGTTTPTAKFEIQGPMVVEGSGDYTNVTSPLFKLQATVGYLRIPYLSSHPSIAVVHNYQTGKDVYWGEQADVGKFFFVGGMSLLKKDI